MDQVIRLLQIKICVDLPLIPFNLIAFREATIGIIFLIHP